VHKTKGEESDVAKTKAAAEDESVGGLSGFEARLTNLLGLLLVKDMKNQGDQIAWLNRVGFKSSEIASLLGTTTNSVSVALYQQKQQKKPKNKKKR
jgi:hypothetical protein